MPVYFNIENKGAKEVSMKATRAEKRRVTIVLVCLASGKTLSPKIIFKGNSITHTTTVTMLLTNKSLIFTGNTQLIVSF